MTLYEFMWQFGRYEGFNIAFLNGNVITKEPISLSEIQVKKYDYDDYCTRLDELLGNDLKMFDVETNTLFIGEC